MRRAPSEYIARVGKPDPTGVRAAPKLSLNLVHVGHSTRILSNSANVTGRHSAALRDIKDKQSLTDSLVRRRYFVCKFNVRFSFTRSRGRWRTAQHTPKYGRARPF